METDTDSSEEVSCGYTDASPMVRLFSYPGAAAVTEELIETSTSPAAQIAIDADVSTKEAREFMDAMAETGAVRVDDGQYGFNRWSDVGLQLIKADGLLPYDGLELLDVIGDETTLRVMDVLLRKYYHGCTVPMLAEKADRDLEAVAEVVEMLSDAGLLESPDEHPADADAIVDDAASADEEAYVVDTENEAVCALGRLQNELLGFGDRIPPA